MFNLLLIILLFEVSANAANQYMYRVHIGSYKVVDSPQKIESLPEVKKYVLPEGYHCFFSGGYYIYFEGALKRLKDIHTKGFKKATIRVYKNEKLVLLIDGLNHIEEESINPMLIPENETVDKQIFSLSRKWTLRNRADFYREMLIPSLTDTTRYKPKNENLESNWNFNLNLFGHFNWTKRSKKESEPEKSPPKGKEKNKEEDLNSDENEENTTYDEALMLAIEEGIVEEKAEEVIEENDEKIELSDQFFPDEKPVFKIYLASVETGGKVPTKIKHVTEIVYTYEKKTLTLYTVGYYASSAKAYTDLANYRNQGFYNAKIIGIYKTIVVSQNIADEILNRTQPKK